MTPEEYMKALVGRTITGVEINTDEEIVTLSVTDGFVQFEGDSLEMYIEFNKDRTQ